MATLKHAIAVNLAELLDNRGMSQTDLADKLGVSFQTINKIINEKAGISTEMIAKIAAVFGIEETDLTVGRRVAVDPIGALQIAKGLLDEVITKLIEKDPRTLASVAETSKDRRIVEMEKRDARITSELANKAFRIKALEKRIEELETALADRGKGDDATDADAEKLAMDQALEEAMRINGDAPAARSKKRR